ncbi:hypothetical protein EG68_10436 [Paragonimus skrjabini miyazakii]|uniref:Selenoprotein O n=1 Tax=Paragonimus skrjabini miyazakii TaxID=59628 RepID=A0A8S9YHC4_9TREM|nr:hypothetical protein EG68_10436 [Paragonimus skrjabini miyazakii]
MNVMQQVQRGPRFDNLALRALPVDTGPNSIRVVSDACFAKAQTTPVESPQLVIASREVFELLDFPVNLIDRAVDFSAELTVLVQYLSGNKVWPASEPCAHCYCGHQFGNFAGQLGDGAVVYLGEVINHKGERWELQLKGAGLTPFSRQADGRKVLRSSLREFLCSEAMYHLGIPTTRAASVITSDTLVSRDVFYTGNIVMERASITCRVAPTFVRFGSFEITKPPDVLTGRRGPSFGNHTILPQLTAYVIEQFYPEIWSIRNSSDWSTVCLSFFEQVVRRTAELVACWQTVGFCHGVLNTDNMSIIGLTIDYGPFGFMDRFTWDSVCNTSDTDGRYSYAQQPSICAWNCARLAECLVRATLDATLSSVELEDASLYQDKQSELMKQFRDVLDVNFMSTFKRCYVDRMKKKLGLFASPADDSADENFFKSLFDTMEQTGADFTNTFLALEESLESVPHSEIHSHNLTLCTDPLVAECCSLDELIEFYEPNDSDVKQEMLLRLIGFDRRICDRLNETKVLKPTEKAVRLRELQHMTEVEKRTRDAHLWRIWLDAYAKRLSLDADLMPNREWCERLRLMRSSNPRIVLRNYMAEEAIKAAESGNFTVARNLLEDLRRPFHTAGHPGEIGDYNKLTSANNQLPPQLSSCSGVSVTHGRIRPPAWARELRVT